jgi:type I restriction enzyme S subunit
MSKINLIPDLRFPEFNEEWSLEELEQCLDYLQPIPYLVESTDYKDEYNTPVLTAGKSFILGYTNEKDGIFKENLPVIIFDDFTTATQFVDFPFKAKSSAMKILLSKNGNDIKFVYEAIQTMNFEVGVHQRHWISIFSKLKIPTPKPKEQQKIASCLSSLDEVIAAHSQKLDLLKDHKKGLMQNLFPQEGEKVPNYRFKEFEKDGVWVEKKLGELIEIKGRIGYRGYTLEDIVGKGEGAISMSPSNINVFGTLSFTKSTYITWAKYEESPEIMLENGFTVLVKTGSTYGKVAFIKNLTEKTTINPQLVVLKPKKVNSYFLYLLVANESIQKQINATVVGGAIPTLSQESISNFEILVPKIKEQEKIAECLSTLNDLIISQTERIEQLKLHKKGLMQGLFPKLQD